MQALDRDLEERYFWDFLDGTDHRKLTLMEKVSSSHSFMTPTTQYLT
jgi:hypothetical protein